MSLSVLVATNSGRGTAYAFDFAAAASDGTQYKLWDMRSESTAPGAGLVLPEIVSLAPGTSREISFPIRDLVYFANGGDISLESLLQQGYRFTASLEVRQKQLEGDVMGGFPPPEVGRFWTGQVMCSLPSLKAGH